MIEIYLMQEVLNCGSVKELIMMAIYLLGAIHSVELISSFHICCKMDLIQTGEIIIARLRHFMIC